MQGSAVCLVLPGCVQAVFCQGQNEFYGGCIHDQPTDQHTVLVVFRITLQTGNNQRQEILQFPIQNLFQQEYSLFT